MATIRIRVNKHLSGSSATGGAIGYAYRLNGTLSSGAKLVAGPIAIPVGPDPRAYADILVEPGEYLLQVRMPSGEDLNESVIAKGPLSKVSISLQAEQSPHEWLSVDHYLGRVPSKQVHDLLERLPDIANDLRAYLRSSARSAQIGTREAPGASKRRKPSDAGRGSARSRDGPPDRTRGLWPIVEGHEQRYTAPPTVSDAQINEALQLIDSTETRLSGFRKASINRLQELSANLPAWRITARHASGSVGLPSGTGELIAWWIGGIVDAKRLAVSVSDDLYLKATVPSVPMESTRGGKTDPGAIELHGIPPGLTRAVPQATTNHGRRRYYFAVLTDDKLSRIGVLPLPWHVVTRGDRHRKPATAELLINYRSGARVRGTADSAPHADMQCGVTVDDPDMLAILGFLKSGNVVGTSALLSRAEQTLFSKVDNPLAAAGAGYVLLQFFDAKQATKPHWRRWVSNLSRWFDAVPDGAIQQGWLELQYASMAQAKSRSKKLTPVSRNHVETARSLLFAAMRRGIPFYPQGVRLLVDSLTLILENDVNERNEPSKETRAALEAARWLSLRVDSREVFTVLRL